MTQKFGRNYRLTIDPKDGNGTIVVQLPFTVQFWTQLNKQASINIFSLEIYNLSAANRKRIFQDFWDYQQQTVKGVDTGWRDVLFEAGYGKNLKTIFQGSIFRASSARQGVDIVTRIEGRTGIYDVNTVMINETYASGQTHRQLLLYLISKFSTVTLGYVGNFPDVFLKPVSLNGPVWKEIQKYSGNKANIENGVVNILKDNEQKEISLYEINDSTGLLATPRRDEGSLSVSMLFEPGIQLDQPVNINTTTEKVYNGIYNVTGIMHEGIISGAVSGDLRTTLTLLHTQTFKYSKVAQG